jgi:organic radical activating enzyme
MKRYSVKEIFYSIQGEGLNSGRAAVFVRFSGCNMWNGRDPDKKLSPCWFCDTNFVGGEKMLAEEIVDRVLRMVPKTKSNYLVVLTGGEPLLQVDDSLVSKLCEAGISVAIETNGSIPFRSKYPVHITVSPKTMNLSTIQPTEVKLLFNNGLNPSEIYEKYKFNTKYFYLQGIDNITSEDLIDYIKNHAEWRLSTQLHKTLGVE